MDNIPESANPPANDVERLSIKQINEGVAYTRGGIGVKNAANSKKGSCMFRKSLKISTGPSAGELATLREEIKDRRSRMGLFFSTLDPDKNFANWKNSYKERIKEEADELELTPEDNMKIHTVRSNYIPSAKNRFKIDKTSTEKYIKGSGCVFSIPKLQKREGEGRHPRIEGKRLELYRDVIHFLRHRF